MSKREFKLTEKEAQLLLQDFAAERDGPTRTRLQAVRLYGLNYAVDDITEITMMSRRTILRATARYRQGGVAGIKDGRVGGNHRYLDASQISEISQRIHHYAPHQILGPAHVSTADGKYWTTADLKKAITKWYDVTYQGNASYQSIFAACGFSFQRTAKR